MTTTAAPWEFCTFAELTPEAKVKAIAEIRKDHDDELLPDSPDSEVITLIWKHEFLFYTDGYRC